MLFLFLESDGYPAGAETIEEKDAFIQEWKQREGIDLRPNHMVKKNAGLRALSKLMLNRYD